MGGGREDVGEGGQGDAVLLCRAGCDAEVAASFQSPLVGAVADVDAVACQQRGGDLGGGAVELEEREVRRARERLDAGERGERGEQSARLADVAAAGALVGAPVVAVG